MRRRTYTYLCIYLCVSFVFNNRRHATRDLSPACAMENRRERCRARVCGSVDCTTTRRGHAFRWWTRTLVCVQQEKPLRAQQQRNCLLSLSVAVVVLRARALTMTLWRDLCQGRCHTHATDAAAAGRAVFYDDNRARYHTARAREKKRTSPTPASDDFVWRSCRGMSIRRVRIVRVFIEAHTHDRRKHIPGYCTIRDRGLCVRVATTPAVRSKPRTRTEIA